MIESGSDIMFKEKKYIPMLLVFILIIIVLKLHNDNSSLKGKILEIENKYLEIENKYLETEKKYQELAEKNASESTPVDEYSERELIRQKFEWMNSENISSFTIQNDDGEIVNINEPSFLNDLIRSNFGNQSIFDFNPGISGYNFHELSYVLRCEVEEDVHELLIFRDGVIQYNNEGFYRSEDLLWMAQALMPIVEESTLDMETALEVMFNSSIATVSTYRESKKDTDEAKPLSGQVSAGYAIRLRASAHFIKENMIKVDNEILPDEDMMVTKSVGFRDGEEVEMYVFTEKGDLHHVKLVYKDTEEFYVLKPSLLEDPKIRVFNNIWTAG